MVTSHNAPRCLCQRHLVLYTKVLLLCVLLVLPTVHSRPAAIRKAPAEPGLQEHPREEAPIGDADINVLGKPDSKEVGNAEDVVAQQGEKDEEKGAIERPVDIENLKVDIKEDNEVQEKEMEDNRGQLERPKEQEEDVVKMEHLEDDEGAGDEDNDSVLKRGHPVAAAIQAAGNLLPLKDLKIPDHLEGVPLEQDGHLNRDYRKEILLGNHEEFEEGDEEEQEEKLKEIYFKVDSNRDAQISQTELEEWIKAKVQEHFKESKEETERIFAHLDANKDGLVGWEEFHIHFLLAKGYGADEAKKHVEDYETVNLDPDEKERLIRYKFRWAEADEEPQDNQLTLGEFASFRHPEQSKSMLHRMVQEIVDNLDQDGDGIVKEAEFIALPPGEVDYTFQESDKVWQSERRKEFQSVIDLNGDGQLSKEELESYVDPQNPNHSKLEAENLIQLADADHNGLLSLAEVLDNVELFMGSKVVDTGRNFHDEF